MPRKKKSDQPIGVGLTSKQMKRKKPINTDMMRDIEPLTDNQKELFHSYKNGKKKIPIGIKIGQRESLESVKLETGKIN